MKPEPCIYCGQLTLRRVFTLPCCKSCDRRVAGTYKPDVELANRGYYNAER